MYIVMKVYCLKSDSDDVVVIIIIICIVKLYFFILNSDWSLLYLFAYSHCKKPHTILQNFQLFSFTCFLRTK